MLFKIQQNHFQFSKVTFSLRLKTCLLCYGVDTIVLNRSAWLRLAECFALTAECCCYLRWCWCPTCSWLPGSGAARRSSWSSSGFCWSSCWGPSSGQKKGLWAAELLWTLLQGKHEVFCTGGDWWLVWTGANWLRYLEDTPVSSQTFCFLSTHF